MGAKKDEGKKLIAQNRRATHDYAISDRLEAGMVLTGTEVKACRTGTAQLQDAYVMVKKNEAFLLNAHIPEYKQGNQFNHEPTRTRKLLLHAKEIEKLDTRQREKGESIVPMSMYFKDGRVKLEIGLGKGKSEIDKRDTLKDRESKREVERALRRGRG